MTIIICCCNNAVNAVVPPELYTNFGIASSSLADTFTATSNVILDDTNIRLNEQSIKFDLLWSAIGRACPPNVFSNDPVNMKLLEKYVRTSGCLATTFFDSHEKYFSHNNNIIPENQKDGVIKIVFYNNNLRYISFVAHYIFRDCRHAIYKCSSVFLLCMFPYSYYILYTINLY